MNCFGLIPCVIQTPRGGANDKLNPSKSLAWLTYDGLFNAGVNRQDVFVDQLHGPRPVGDFIVQIISEASPLQLQLLGLK